MQGVGLVALVIRVAGFWLLAILPVMSAGAQVPQNIKPADLAMLVGAFKAICVEPGVDATAQIATVKAELWALPSKGASEEVGELFGRLYQGTPLQVSIKASGQFPNCSVLTVLPTETTLEAAEAAFANGLSIRGAKFDSRRSQIDWPEAFGDKRWVTFSLKKSADMTVGIFAAFDPTAR